MRFASLGSGSQGNGTVVEAGTTRVLVDCGFGIRESVARLKRLGLEPAQLDGILVTHEHGDHCNGVAALSRKYSLPVFLSYGTARCPKLNGCAHQNRFNAGDVFSIGELEITPVPVPHDAREPTQFRFDCDGHRLGVITDLGCITPHVIAAFGGCTGMLLEFNHDVTMLKEGAYPASLKARVGGDFGHLNNSQAADFLEAVDTSCLQRLVAGHLSQQNNSPQATLDALSRASSIQHVPTEIACQAQGFDWIDLTLQATLEPSQRQSTFA